MAENSKIANGGPAFPTEPNSQPGFYAHHGMSIREWFAGQALVSGLVRVGPLSERELSGLLGGRRTNIRREEIIAAETYRIADAMLAQRTKIGGAE